MAMTIKYQYTKHPQYRALRKPTSGCVACWAMWCIAQTFETIKMDGSRLRRERADSAK